MKAFGVVICCSVCLGVGLLGAVLLLKCEQRPVLETAPVTGNVFTSLDSKTMSGKNTKGDTNGYTDVSMKLSVKIQ